MPELVHCSYHKCLTAFFKRVMVSATGRHRGYRHFNSLLGDWTRGHGNYEVSSVNNHALDLSALGPEARISRFVRDPRDLIVSGYFYHRADSERWCSIVDPTDGDWAVVCGTVPSAMRHGESYAQCLQRLDPEDGLLAEIEWRTQHFASMLRWPTDDSRVRTWRYEDIVGNESATMCEVADHYGMPSRTRAKMAQQAMLNESSRRIAARDGHVRNPASGQWKEMFTPRVEEAFMARWAEILPRYGYE